MRKYSICHTFFCIMVISNLYASDPDISGMEKVFTEIEKTIKTNDIVLYESLWHPEGYNENLVGGSGVSGLKVFRQGTRKKWYLKPDMTKLLQDQRGGMFIIPCDVWSWEKNKAVDKVYALPIYSHEKKRWLLLGTGEKKDEVFALASRYQNKKPLKP